jgi:hypothetical protein
LLAPLILLALLSSDISSDRFALSRDLLPFGVPTEFDDGRSPVLTIEEVAACFNTYVAVQRARLKLDLDRARLAVDESHGVINRQKSLNKVPKDELDKQLDEIERSLAENSSLMRDTREFLSRRTKFFREYAAFIEDCGDKTYRASDVRTLFPNGVPK